MSNFFGPLFNLPFGIAFGLVSFTGGTPTLEWGYGIKGVNSVSATVFAVDFSSAGFKMLNQAYWAMFMQGIAPNVRLSVSNDSPSDNVEFAFSSAPGTTQLFVFGIG